LQWWRLIRRRVDPRIVVVTVVALIVIGAGIASYRITSSRGVDIDAARIAAEHAGEARGRAEGNRQGFAKGFASTRDDAYRSAYRDAYVSAFRNQFNRAGLAVPNHVVVKRQ
jgi:hypothetical protein